MKSLFFVLILLLISSGGLSAAENIGMIKVIKGSVIIKRSNTMVDATEGMNIKENDKIITKAKSSAGIIFEDNSVVTIGENSEFNINSYVFEPKNEKYGFDVYLAKGKAVYNSGKMSKLAPEKVNFNTPRATLGIRGTKFIVEVDE